MFGWFKKYEELRQQEDARLRELFKIGDTFKYLGRECRVCAHGYGVMDLGWIPCLVCDYADNHGVIRQIKFRPDESEMIAKAR